MMMMMIEDNKPW